MSDSAEPQTASRASTTDDASVNSAQLSNTHKRWLKSVIGLSALEAKIWVASSAQLLALMCGVVFLLVTSWLLIIATGAVVAWHFGFSLIGILISAVVLTLVSAMILLWLVKRTLSHINFTRTLDAIIPTDEDDKD
ncbi:hypothetical protein DN730_06430 [Marinomonas piezotolerans]|uniref:Phage holin family protein n=1 Tax=Marinomonas piezotolerans TaxID=2213058 RepID=A0A370UBR0_9GAMM|nr:hypothetical protein [Marinomonas piezotolerans]RDL45243.1 hypothetical protein DN730_06430 [Marinomonas piezotolerans]